MADLFPTSGVEDADYDAAASGDDSSYGKTVQFDFEKHEFMLSPTGKMKTASGSDAWGEWCVKALCTERYKYLIYSTDYGEELDTLMGQSKAHQLIESEVRRMTKECLECDPRTASVDEFSFQWIDDGFIFSCRVTNTLGEAMEITRMVVR